MAKKAATAAAASSAAPSATKKKDARKNSKTKPPQPIDVDDHLPPIVLVMTILACSGFVFVYSFRDVFATGRNIGGTPDEVFLAFTNSIAFYDDAKGWKSQQGGLSSISQVTTDDNNMGGLFVRKVGGAASLAVSLQKMVPLLFHPTGAVWNRGHFTPLLVTSLLGNLALIGFYGYYIKEELAAVGAEQLPLYFVSVWLVESLVILFCLVFRRKAKTKAPPAVAMQNGKTPNSIVSRIVARTNLLVSGCILLIAGRDLFAPGHILTVVPRDDIYLEWTGALLHSPPEDSPEAQAHGVEKDFYVADKFLSQLLALNMLILVAYKFVASLLIKTRSDNSGLIMSKMIWKPAAIGQALILYLFRLFAPAAKTASLDFRWHLMMLAYETLILGLYGWL